MHHVIFPIIASTTTFVAVHLKGLRGRHAPQGVAVNQPANPDFEKTVRQSFARQQAMDLIRATLTKVEHGHAEISMPHWDGIEQQHGFVHGGVVGMVADSAAGYAGMTVVPADASVLSVEYKLNFLAPARGSQLVARGQVVRPGRTLIVTKAEVYSIENETEVLCALMQQTIMVMHGNPEKQLKSEH